MLVSVQARLARHLTPHGGQHLQRYLAEFTGRHNVRDADTAEQMGRLVAGLNGRRLPWRMLAGSARVLAAA